MIQSETIRADPETSVRSEGKGMFCPLVSGLGAAQRLPCEDEQPENETTQHHEIEIPGPDDIV